jgi:hypothetical protein
MARRQNIVLMGTTGQGGDGTQTGTGSAFQWPGGDGLLLLEAAAFNAATINLQMQNVNGTWINLQNYATTTPIGLTANGVANFRAPAGPIRIVGGAATGIVAQAVGIPQNVAG